MQCVAAARHCLHNLFRVWNGELKLTKEKQVQLAAISSVSNVNSQAWKRALGQLVGDRNLVIHFDEAFAPPVPHPGYTSHVSDVSARYTTERATEAVDILMESVIRPVLQSPSTKLQSFADQYVHVLSHLDHQRSTGAFW